MTLPPEDVEWTSDDGTDAITHVESIRIGDERQL
jgi:hypothetical protein